MTCCKRVRVSPTVRIGVVAVTAALLLAAGCGGAGNARTANDLRGIGLMYHEYHNANAKAPDKLEDLKAYSSIDPKGYEALAAGQYVFVYGVRLLDMPEGTSKTVLAYEKDAPTKGGYVLMGDGSVQKLTAKEFQAAPKAQAKSKPAGETK